MAQAVKASAGGKEYSVQKWEGGTVKLVFDESTTIHLIHARIQETITIVDSKRNQFYSPEKLYKTLTSSNPSRGVYLEWLQQSTGQYFYYELSSLVHTYQTTSISSAQLGGKNILGAVKYKPSFDESVELSTKLSKHDILILSPTRSKPNDRNPYASYFFFSLFPFF